MIHYHDGIGLLPGELSFKRGFALFFLAAFWPIASLAQTAKEAPLSPEAQQDLDQGLTAAKQQEWTVAIRYFNQARQAASDSPVPLFNLGLAESQLPGHELRAICWFEAYLAAVPNADKAPAIRQQITTLENRTEGNADKIIEMLKVLAGQIAPSDYWGNWAAYPDIAGLLATSGDLDAAEQIVASQADATIKGHARMEIAQALAKAKRIPDAIKEDDQIPDSDSSKEQSWQAIVSAQIAAGLLSDAKNEMDHLNGADQWTDGYALAEAEDKSGQHDDAVAILDHIKSTFPKVDSSSTDKELDELVHNEYLVDFAEAEYKIGMHEAADATFKQIKEFAYDTKGALTLDRKSRSPCSDRVTLLGLLAEAEDQIGRRSVALQLISEAESACREGLNAHEAFAGLQGTVVEVLCRHEGINDWDGATAWLNQNRENVDHYTGLKDEMTELEMENSQASTKAACFKILADTSSTPAQRAKAWLDYINGCLSAPLFTSDFNVTLAGLANFTPSSDDPAKAQTIFNHVKQTAVDLIDRLNDVHEMEGAGVSGVAAPTQNQSATTVPPASGTTQQ
jgi:tetratricopeptide (TPR) repeat protein